MGLIWFLFSSHEKEELHHQNCSKVQKKLMMILQNSDNYPSNEITRFISFAHHWDNGISISCTVHVIRGIVSILIVWQIHFTWYHTCDTIYSEWVHCGF